MMKVTVIVPVYNTERYLDECITSLISQTEDFDEIILINDGSTDGSREICEKYRSQYPNIALFNQSNKGLAAARNAGMKKAGGNYILFVDSDDYMAPDACACIKRALRAKATEVLYYNADIQYDIPSSESRNAYRHNSDLDGRYVTGMNYIEEVFPGQYTVSVCVAAYSKNFLEQYGIYFPEGMYFEDNYFSLQVISKAKIVSGIQNRIYIRRCRKNSIMTGSMTKKKCRDLIANQKLIWQYLTESPEWVERKDMLRKWIAFGVLHTFSDLSAFPDKNYTDCLKHDFVCLFLRYWTDLFREESKDPGVALAFLLVLKEALSEWQRSRKADGPTTDFYTERQLCRELKRTEDRVYEQIAETLRLLPFQRENASVGIYGMGKHTQILLNMYRKEIGPIRSELFFIVSEKKGKQCFFDRKVITYKEIPKNVDYIVVSSSLHQQEMYKNLLDENIAKDQIYLFYTRRSVCDLIMADWVMNYKHSR